MEKLGPSDLSPSADEEICSLCLAKKDFVVVMLLVV